MQSSHIKPKFSIINENRKSQSSVTEGILVITFLLNIYILQFFFIKKMQIEPNLFLKNIKGMLLE